MVSASSSFTTVSYGTSSKHRGQRSEGEGVLKETTPTSTPKHRGLKEGLKVEGSVELQVVRKN